MPRINTVKKARKDQGSCGGCSKAIAAGDSYKWIKFPFGGGKRKRCSGCGFKNSDLTNSDKLSRAYAAQENAEEALGHVSHSTVSDDACEVKEILESAATEIREVGEEYQESADNIRESFAESSTADECEEKAENLEGWADELESWEPSEEFEPEEHTFDEPEKEDDESDDAHASRIISEREEWLTDYQATNGHSPDDARTNFGERCVEEGEEAISNCPL